MSVRCIAAAAAAAAVAGCASFAAEEPEAELESGKPVVAIVRPAPPNVTAVAPAPIPTPPPAVVAPPPVEVVRPSDTDLLVQEFARMRRLTPPELAREQDAARNTFNQSRSDSARVRFAMALAVPGAPASDDTRALDLLDPLVRSPAAGLHALALLLSSYIQEQRRLASQLASLQQNVQGLQQNVHALQQKLDALKTLERSLSERETGMSRRR